MPSKNFLRTLIVAEICLGIISLVVSIFTESSLPQPLQTFLETESEAENGEAMLVILIPLLILALVSSMGLFFFWNPARLLYLVTIVIGFVLTPVFGPYVDTGWTIAFENASVTISGAILALIYLSPLRDLYEKPKATT